MVFNLDLFLLLLGFVFTFFVPGILVIQTFYKDLSKIQKIPLIMLLSVLISTYVVYFSSLLIGYSRLSILISFSLFLPWIIYLYKKQKINLSNLSNEDFIREHFLGVILSLVISAIFFVALLPGIFTKYNGYYVMSAVNWQDTALHQSIIETLSQGNFPPQAPYFSGAPLQYYYFTDFHSSILEVLYNRFFPQILVYDNPIFVLIFCLFVYSLTFYITGKKWVGFFAVLICIFNSNFMFVRFLSDITARLDYYNLIQTIDAVKDNLATHVYTIEFEQLLQFAPTVDYLLQNRPMMVGLPAVVAIYLLCLSGFEERKYKLLFLAGMIASMLIKFQLFAALVGLMTFFLALLFYSFKLNKKVLVKFFVFFFLPFLSLLIIFYLLSPKSSITIEVFKLNTSFGPWYRDKNVLWYGQFFLLNFGIPLLLAICAILGYLFRLIKLPEKFNFLILVFIVLLIIPFIIRFTIYEGDMLKFYYFMIIIISTISAFVLNKIWRFSFIGPFIVFVIIGISSFTSVLTLVSSYLNKNAAYSKEDYTSGIWIRGNTPQKAVFIEVPKVHSAVSDIGGRLRILSYINWPYTHGFNKGEDNVFSRQDDIQSLYKNSSNQENTLKIMNKYNAKYIYLSPEEINVSPNSFSDFQKNNSLKLIYHLDSVSIFELR